MLIVTRKDSSKAERINYARRLERIESLKVRKRQEATLFGGGENVSTNIGLTRDIVASKIGIDSGNQYEKKKYIVENKDSLTP